MRTSSDLLQRRANKVEEAIKQVFSCIEDHEKLLVVAADSWIKKTTTSSLFHAQSFFELEMEVLSVYHDSHDRLNKLKATDGA